MLPKFAWLWNSPHIPLALCAAEPTFEMLIQGNPPISEMGPEVDGNSCGF